MRSKKREQERGIDKMVGVKLTPERRTEIGQMMATKLVHAEALKDQLKKQSKELKDQITSETTAARDFARMLLNDEETKAQGDLFVGQTQQQAQTMLHDVAEKVEPSKSPAETLPSEPHAFTPAEPGGIACFVCGSSESDPVHAQLQTGFAAAADDGGGDGIAPGNGNGRAHARKKARRRHNDSTRAKGKRGRGREARA